MNCKTCGYALWNLRTRVCPECGETFDPRDFEFAPTTVRFCCPHCNQAYYGTSAKGHLVPEAFECVKCGQHISMAEMIVLPAEGVTERETTPLIVPWIERHNIGVMRGWFKTIGWGFAYGPQIGRGLESTSRARQAILFAAVTLAITLACWLLPILLFMFIGMASSMGSGGAATVSTLVGVIIFCAAVILTLLMGLGLGSLLAHGGLRLLGAGKGQLGRTMEAVNYSCGPMVVSAVPCVGVYLFPIGWIWWTISSSLALAEAHCTKVWKCVVAMLVPALLVPAVPIAAYIIFIMSMIGGMGGVGGTSGIMAQAASQMNVSSLTMAWRTKSVGWTNSEPMHASELLDAGYVNGTSFFSNSSALAPADVPIGSLTLADFTNSTTSFTPEQAAAVAEASAALPANTIAHRVGDYVFTYHGIDQMTAPSGLWVVIADPVRDPYAPPAPNAFYVVGQIDSATQMIPGADFASALATQNQLRASYGLAPLPMPNTVTPSQPAVAGN